MLKLRLFGLAALAAALLPSPASAQHTERIRAGAETRWARQSQQHMQAKIAAGPGIAAQALGRDPVAGTMSLVVLPVSYANDAVSFPSEAIQAHLFGAGSASMTSVSQYYTDASFNTFNVTGATLDPVLLPQADSYYTGSRTNPRFGRVADRLDEFLLDALRLADQTVDWRPYADPEDPGVVAGLVILAAGPGGQCSSGASKIWPHRWTMRGALGQPFRTRSTTERGDTIIINDYIIQGVRDCTTSAVAPNGVIIHEVGHLLGLPDLYDTTDPAFHGPVGHWDVMATGNYATPETPTMMGAVSRWLLGWVNPIAWESNPDVATTVSLPPVQGSRSTFRLQHGVSDEFYLLEHRRRGSATDQQLPGEGLLVWYVNPTQLLRGLAYNGVNTERGKPGIAVIQADGQSHLESGLNRGDAGDPWPGSSGTTSFSRSSVPAARSPLDNSTFGFALSGISSGISGGVPFVQFTVVSDALSPLIIEPAVIAGLPAGLDAALQLSVSDAAAQSLIWSANPQHLQSLGLALDSITGRLTGRVTPGHGSYPLTVSVRMANSERTGRRDYMVEVLPRPAFTAEDAVYELLYGQARLSTDAARFLDAVGNRNGQFDIGDFVAAVRAGEIVLTPELRRRLGRVAATIDGARP
jgi:M6 family metalloprotease-like protein